MFLLWLKQYRDMFVTFTEEDKLMLSQSIISNSDARRRLRCKLESLFFI